MAERTSTQLHPAPPSCSQESLAGQPMARRDTEDRVVFLLQWMVSAARADSGVVRLSGPNGTLHIRASLGLAEPGFGVVASSHVAASAAIVATNDAAGAAPSAVGDDPWLHRGAHPAPCRHDVLDRPASLVLGFPLGSDKGRLGVVEVGFRTHRDLRDNELARCQVIADHIAAVVESSSRATELEARNAELERANATLLHLDRLKADFLSMVSHELRTPLTAIIGYTDLLLRGSHGSLNDRQTRHQGAVKKAAHRLLALVNDLLDVSRLESGRIELARDAILLHEVATAAVREIGSAAHQRGISVHLDALAASPWVDADPRRVHQILMNLLDNAVKFTPEGGRVTLRLRVGGGHASVTVEDTGAGVPPEELGRIWDRFHQADSSARRHFGGTGLGLAIVRNLVELHGGQVSVASAGVGVGSRFSFTLPLAATPAPVAAVPPSPPRAPVASTARRVVLIVDDEPDNREVIATLIGDDLGYETRCAVDGEEALELARSLPDLILLDLRMAGLSGFEVAERLKADPATAHIPIVAITALADEDDQQAARDAGCVGCLTKPFTPAKLTAIVVDALRMVGASSR